MKRFFKVCLTIVYLFLIISCVKDEETTTGRIYGIVVDAQTGEPVQGANVSLTPGGKSAITGSSGNYEFTDLEMGQYKIQVQKTGYQSNLKQISVVVGQVTSGDISIRQLSENSKVGVNKDVLDFGTEINSLTFDVINKGSLGNLDWNITGTSVWMKVSPLSGTTAINKSSVVKVDIDRSKITQNVSTSIIINADGESLPILINVDVDGNKGSETPAGESKEDYSTASVESCDSRIEVDIINCKRTGSSVVFSYYIKNASMFKDIDEFRLYALSSTDYSYVMDDTGLSYTYQNAKFTLAGHNSNSGLCITRLLEGIKVPGTITLTGVSSDAKFLSVGVYCIAYPESQYNLATKYIKFSNVPIY